MRWYGGFSRGPKREHTKDTVVEIETAGLVLPALRKANITSVAVMVTTPSGVDPSDAGWAEICPTPTTAKRTPAHLT